MISPLSSTTNATEGTIMPTEQIDRPTDVANRAYYNGGQQWRRVRVVVEADVEWRDDDPGYCLGVARVDIGGDGPRVRQAQVVSAELRDPADDRPVDPVAGEGTDAERGTWDEVDTKQRLRNIVDLCEWAAHDDDQGAVKTRAILDLARGVPLDRSGWDS